MHNIKLIYGDTQLSAFVLSQILISIAIVFDLASFQFKSRREIIGCLCFAGILISSHFILLEQWGHE